jgi:transcriptional regulator with XRE-family HTH domain
MDEQQSLEIGAYIRARREDASLSTRELASRVGVDMAQIVRLEQGKVASPRADLLGRIADELKIPASDLMTMAGYPTPRALPNLRPTCGQVPRPTSRSARRHRGLHHQTAS